MFGPISAGVGAIAGVASSVIQARSARQAAKEQAEQLAEAQRKAAELVQGQSALERERMLKLQKQAQWEAQQVTSVGKQAAARMAMAVFGSPAYQAQAGFLADLYNNPIPESLATDVSGRLRTAQAARGLTGYAASKDEANVLANMAFQARQQLLPQLRQLAYDPYQLQMEARAQEQQLYGGAQQIGLAGLQSAVSSLGAGQQMASSIYSPLVQGLYNTASQTPVYGGSALASGLGALAGALPGVGSAISQYQSQGQLGQLLALMQQKAV